MDSTYIEEKVRKIAKALFITSNLATPAELAPPPSLAVGALPSDEGEVESAGASLAPSRLGLGLGGDNAGTGTPAGTATGAATGTGDATGIGEFTGTGAITGTGDLTGTGVAIGAGETTGTGTTTGTGDTTGTGTTTGDTTGTGTGITGALGGESRAGGTMTVLTCTTEML